MLTAHDVRRVAVAAICDERTIRRRLRGLPVQSTSAARIDAALAELGLVGARTVPAASAAPRTTPPSAA